MSQSQWLVKSFITEPLVVHFEFKCKSHYESILNFSKTRKLRVVFTSIIGMLIHSWKVAGTVNSPLVTKGTFQFITHGLAVMVK